MSEVWLEPTTVMQLERWSASTLRVKLRGGHLDWRFKPGARNLRNGKKPRQISAKSLSAQAQLKLAQIGLATAHVPTGQSDTAQAPLFAAASRERVALDQKQTEAAQRKLEILQPLLDHIKRGGRTAGIKLPDGPKITNLEDLADYVAAQHRVSARTLFRWLRKLKKSGLPGLAPAARADAHTHRFFREHPTAGELLQRKRFGERLSVALSFEALRRECERLQVESPSYQTCRRYLRSLPGPLQIYALEGARSYQDKCAPYISQDYTSVAPGELFVADHSRFDCFVSVSDDSFPGARPGVPWRPWLTAFMCWASRKIVGFSFSAVPSSDSISTALRMAVESCGIPDSVLLDNGRDFKAVQRFSPEALGVLARLGIRTINSLPYNARAKNIERFFGTLHSRFDALWPTYCGSSPSRRPEHCDELLREHKRLIKTGQSHLSQVPDAREFFELATAWILEEYNHRPHAGHGMHGKSPNQVWDQAAPRPHPEDVHALDVLMWHRQRRKVSEGGCIQLYGARYEPADESSSSHLFMEIGRDVQVCSDPSNVGEAIALDLDGVFLGKLKAAKLLARGPISREEVRGSIRKQRRFARVVRDYVTFLREGHQPELDQLRKRAAASQARMPQLPAAPEILPAAHAVGETRFIEDIVDDFLKGDDDGA